jgi:hypothetical protein
MEAQTIPSPVQGPAHRTPGHRVVHTLGGVRAVAELAGRDRVQVYRWLKARERGGLGGRIPHAVQTVLVRRAADEAGIVLTLADFLPRDGEAFL